MNGIDPRFRVDIITCQLMLGGHVWAPIGRYSLTERRVIVSEWRCTRCGFRVAYSYLEAQARNAGRLMLRRVDGSWKTNDEIRVEGAAMLTADHEAAVQGYQAAFEQAEHVERSVEDAISRMAVAAESRLATISDSREPACVEAWPGCQRGAYDPRCCRFPKPCSVQDVG